MEKLTGNIEQNVEEMKRRFERDFTFIVRTAVNRSGVVFYLLYCGGMIDNAVVDEYIIAPLLDSDVIEPKETYNIATEVLCAHFPAMTDNFEEIEESVASGDTVVLLPGGLQAVILSTQGFSVRGISEPGGEKVLSGPREGFSESLMGNLTMLHRRLRNGDFKIENRVFGRRTRTRAAVCYIESLVKKPLLEELYKRLDAIDIDGVLDSHYLTELISDNRWSPFMSVGTTERPDTVAAKLLEGRIALLADGSPVALTLPYLFSENFQSNEDYYVSFFHAAFARILRIAAFFLTTFTPAIYICLTSFHYEILPGSMLLNMASEFHNTPFPAAFEAFFMLIVFDILRETGMRMPTNGGQALSIVGALIIGQASVEAKLVSPQMIIVVAITGITGLLVPKLNDACLYLRFLLLSCASLLGIFGLSAGIAVSVIHAQRLRSLGVGQFGGTKEDRKDMIIRAPLWKMTTRPSQLSENRKRMAGRKH